MGYDPIVGDKISERPHKLWVDKSKTFIYIWIQLIYHHRLLIDPNVHYQHFIYGDLTVVQFPKIRSHKTTEEEKIRWWTCQT
jgi:hypothetical protein